MHSFHLKFSSNETPKIVIDSARFILQLFITSFGKSSAMFSFSLGLWKNEFDFGKINV